MHPFDFANGIFLESTEPERQRLGARLWLSEALDRAQAAGEPVGPASVLLSALEGLDFGTIAPMLRLPEGVATGGHEGAPGDIGVEGFILAAVDTLVKTGLSAKAAIALVADDFAMEESVLANLRKKMSSERAKPASRRMRYKYLIECYESDMRRMAEVLTEEDPRAMLYMQMARVSQFAGKT